MRRYVSRKRKPEQGDSVTQRKRRALTHDIRLLGRELFKDGEEIVFHVQGTRLYKISYTVADGWTCSCPDFAHNHHVCKHIYFVQDRALKIQVLVDVPNAIQFGTPQEIMQKLERSGLKPKDILRNDYQSTGDEKSILIERLVVQKPFWGESCAICFEEFTKPENEVDRHQTLESIVYCYSTCGQSVHLNCFEASCKFSKQVQCPYCRGTMKHYQRLGRATDIPNTEETAATANAATIKIDKPEIMEANEQTTPDKMEASIQNAILEFLSPLDTPDAIQCLPLCDHKTLDAWYHARANIIFTSTKKDGWRIKTYVDNVLFSPWGPAIVSESTVA